MTIVFTRHAQNKFKVLQNHRFPISQRLVLNTIKQPAMIDFSRYPLLIAQRNIDKAHVLRVVYKKEQSLIKIVTFYPGRVKQYT